MDVRGLRGDVEAIRDSVRTLSENVERWFARVDERFDQQKREMNEKLMRVTMDARGCGQVSDADVRAPVKEKMDEDLMASSSPKEWVRFGLSFSGKAAEEDFGQFIYRFETCRQLSGVPKDRYIMLLGLYVKDIAATYYGEVSQSLGTKVSYERFKECLISRLNATKGAEQTTLEVSTVKQKQGESVTEYYSRFRKVAAQGSLSGGDPFVLLHFRLGLRTAIRSNVMALAEKN